MSVESQPPALPPETRQRVFNAVLADRGRWGEVLILGPHHAQVIYPAQRVNHILHLLLSLVTLALWVPIWVILSLLSKPERREVLLVDQWGRLTVNGTIEPTFNAERGSGRLA